MPGLLADTKDDAGDVLLGSTIFGAIEGLQHSAGTGALLQGQPCVRRNFAAMQRRQEPVHCLKATETIDVERDDSDAGLRWITGKFELEFETRCQSCPGGAAVLRQKVFDQSRAIRLIRG